MAFDPGAPPRARRSAIVGFVLFGAGLILVPVSGLLLRVPLLASLGAEDFEVARNVSVAISLAPVIASIVAFLISAQSLAVENRASELKEAALRSQQIEVGAPPPESFPQDPRPDTTKYTYAQIALFLGIFATPSAALLALLGTVKLIGANDAVQPLLWAVLVIGALITAGSIVALPFVYRAKANANARWEIAQREAREAAADPS